MGAIIILKMKLYTVREIATLRNVRKRTVNYWIQGGLLRAIRAGSMWMISEREINKLGEVSQGSSKTGASSAPASTDWCADGKNGQPRVPRTDLADSPGILTKL